MDSPGSLRLPIAFRWARPLAWAFAAATAAACSDERPSAIAADASLSEAGPDAREAGSSRDAASPDRADDVVIESGLDVASRDSGHDAPPFPGDAEAGSTCGLGEPCCDGACRDGLRCARSTCSCIRSLAGDHYVRTDGSVFAVVSGVPVPIVRADTGSPLTGIVAVSEATAHACGLDDAGQVWCWSTRPHENAAGELGNGVFGGVLPLHHADRVRTSAGDAGDGYLTDVVLLESSSRCSEDRTACAVRAGGSLWCWGSATRGALFNAGADSPIAVPVATDAVGEVDAVSVGAEHACVLGNGAVHCWGDNDTGALGTGDRIDQAEPTRVPLPGPADEIGAAVGTSCARVGAAVYCWGANDRGQVGIGSPTAATDGCAIPCKLSPVRVEGQIEPLDSVVRLVVGNRYACALRTDAELHCWGSGAASFASPLQLADFGRVVDVVEASVCGAVGVSADIRFLTPDGHVHLGKDVFAPSCP